VNRSIGYRNATRAELDLAVEWAAAEGWNPGLDDAEVFWEFDPEGFVCAEQDGEVVASGSIVSYGKYGFMGFFIVRPDLRGQGIGREFWHWRRQRLLHRLGENSTIGMDGVFDMQPFYAKGGFEFSHRNLRMQSTGRTSRMDRRVRPLSEIPFDVVREFDYRHFGCDRERFLKRWIQLPNGLGFGFVNGDNLTGMGVIRRCGSGFKIGPLFAEDDDVAEELFAALSHHAEGQSVYLDVPENNPRALELARRHAMSEVFGCARMYHGDPLRLPTQNVFGITTFELG
jgi:GNAT superfamily N-acetyltransferase